MKVLVTGGAGTIGRSVVNDLLAHGFEVRVLDKTKGALVELKNPALEIIEGGIEDPQIVSKAISGTEVVYHLAETFSANPYEVLDIDIKGNLNLLTAAIEHGVKHYLFASTHRVYGRPRHLPVDEEHPLHPEESGRAIYGAAKVANEKLCFAFWEEHNLPITIFRPWWSFSPAIRGRVLRNMVDAALKGEPIRVPEKSGGNFLHNDDAALAFRLATLKSQAYGQVFNLTSDFFTTWRELAEIVLELADSSSKLEFISEDERSGDPLAGADLSVYYHCELDISKAKRLIEYKPTYSSSEVKNLLKETIAQLVQARKKG